MLKQLVDEQQSDWDSFLSLVAMAYRGCVHETTAQTPNRIMLGRELPMPSHLLVPTPDNHIPSTPNMCQYVKNLEKKLHKVHELVITRQEKQFRRQKKEYDKTAVNRQLTLGKTVWLFNPTRKLGLSPKLQMKWEQDPYTITKVISDFVVEISRKNKRKVVHVDYLEPTRKP